MHIAAQMGSPILPFIIKSVQQTLRIASAKSFIYLRFFSPAMVLKGISYL